MSPVEPAAVTDTVVTHPADRFHGMERTVTVIYEGPPRGAFMVAQELNDEGFDARMESPLEKRSGGIVQDAVVYIALRVGENVLDDTIQAALANIKKKVSDGAHHIRLEVERHRKDDQGSQGDD